MQQKIVICFSILSFDVFFPRHISKLTFIVFLKDKFIDEKSS